MRQPGAIAAILALLLASGATACSEMCIDLYVAASGTTASMVGDRSQTALNYFASTLVPDLGLSSAVTTQLRRDASNWWIKRFNVILGHPGHGQDDKQYDSYVFLTLCGRVSSGVGPGLAKALALDSWKGKTALETHVRVIAGYKDAPRTACFLYNLDVYSSDSNAQCATDWNKRMCLSNPPSPTLRSPPSPRKSPPSPRSPSPRKAPPSPRKSPPPPRNPSPRRAPPSPRKSPSPAKSPPPAASCTKQCLSWRFSAASPIASLECPKAESYFRTRFVPDLHRTLGSSLGSQFAKDAAKWAVSDCALAIGDDFENGVATYIVKLEICGPVSPGVGPAIAKAIDFANWRGVTPLPDHGWAITGFKPEAADACFLANIEAYGLDEKGSQGLCSSSWSIPCVDLSGGGTTGTRASPTPKPSPRKAPPSPRKPPSPTPPACTKQCVRWLFSAESASTSIDVSECLNAEMYFRDTFVPDAQRSLGPSLGALFAQGAADWRVEDCALAIGDDFENGIATYIVELLMCGPVHPAGVGPALASALSERNWKGTQSLKSHGWGISGFEPSADDTCVRASIEAYGVDETGDKGLCSAAYNAPCVNLNAKPKTVA